MHPIVAIAAAVTLSTGTVAVEAQSWSPPADSQRCPSKWGAGDQRGSANHMKADTVLRAARLIRTGEFFELGRVLSASMPFGGTRRFEVHTKRTVMNPGSNRRGSNEEMVLSEIGQVGTQFDAFRRSPAACTTALRSMRSPHEPGSRASGSSTSAPS
jgi:hypothetical protein